MLQLGALALDIYVTSCNLQRSGMTVAILHNWMHAIIKTYQHMDYKQQVLRQIKHILLECEQLPPPIRSLAPFLRLLQMSVQLIHRFECMVGRLDGECGCGRGCTSSLRDRFLRFVLLRIGHDFKQGRFEIVQGL